MIDEATKRIDAILDNWCSEWRTLDRDRFRGELLSLVLDLQREKAELERLICTGCGGRQTSEEREHDKDCPCGSNFMTLEGTVRHHQTQVVNLQAELEILKQSDIRNHEIMVNCAEDKAELEVKLTEHGPCHGPEDCPQAELQAKVCEMRKLLEGCHMFLCDSDYGEDPQHTQLEEDVGKALSSASSCPHKEEAEKLREELAVGEAGGRLLKAVQEKTEAEVVALQVANCAMRGALEESAVAFGIGRTTATLCSPDLSRRIQVVLSSSSTCAHEEGRIKAEESYEKYRDEALRWHRVAGEREEQITTLQAALDEANGKVMEWEFWERHSKNGQCACRYDMISSIDRERHSWCRERWTEEAKKQRCDKHD